MNRRSATGLLVLLMLFVSFLYLWQPWRAAEEARINLGLDLKGGLRVVLQASEGTPLREDLQGARTVIENRINAFGVAEPLIQTSGDNRIVVELPGLTTGDTQRALDLIGQQAVLEFRLVRPEASEPLTEAALEPAAFTGEILRSAHADFNRSSSGAVMGGAIVGFEVGSEFAQEFGDFTAANVGRRMAIVLDGNVVSAPTIQSRISDQGQISGMADLNEASDLALVLRSGSLPISLQVEETRSIGPTLGADSIRAGLVAGAIGTLAVVVTILLYYGPLFGGVLSLSLAYVMLLIFGVLAGLGAVLTLPGLAGLVLTIGAAVDGNVISFERIKEELRAGKSLRLAMRSGFQNSLSAIIDANVTTLFAAAALYQYTSGPVRGFAITLAIGIIASVFVNTVVVPFMLDVLTYRFKRPLMLQGFRTPSFGFLKLAPVTMSISGLLAVASLVLVLTVGFRFSTDFSGGTTVLLNVPESVTVDEVRSAIDGLDYAGLTGASATVQEVQDATTSGKEVSVRVGTLGAQGESFPARLSAAVAGSSVLQSDFVGPAIGEELRTGAWLAMLVSFGLVLAYLGFRFWPNWIVAISTVITTAHDVGLVLGVLALTGAEFSIPVLAALLFVVGYSLNDSIVIADRIRENLRTTRGASYADIINLAVNQTLSRTVMTSFTTLLPVLALFLFGGSVLRDFSLTLLLGIGFGVYSSIFIMAPMIVWFKNRQRQPQRSLAHKAT